MGQQVYANFDILIFVSSSLDVQNILIIPTKVIYTDFCSLKVMILFHLSSSLYSAILVYKVYLAFLTNYPKLWFLKI